MKELQKEFEGRGEVKDFHFSQKEASNKAYVYEVSGNENSKHYEVFKRKENTYYDCVSYPTSKAFGIYAWCYKSKEKAISKYNELNKEENK
jgi:hypothetical protein